MTLSGVGAVAMAGGISAWRASCADRHSRLLHHCEHILYSPTPTCSMRPAGEICPFARCWLTEMSRRLQAASPSRTKSSTACAGEGAPGE